MTEGNAWSGADLDTIEKTDELHISSRRPDGTLRNDVTIWVVRVGDEVFVRSANGPENPWYRRAIASGEGHIRVGAVASDVVFENANEAGAAASPEAIDAAYHAKYDHYGPSYVDPVVDATARGATILIVPKA